LQDLWPRSTRRHPRVLWDPCVPWPLCVLWGRLRLSSMQPLSDRLRLSDLSDLTDLSDPLPQSLRFLLPDPCDPWVRLDQDALSDRSVLYFHPLAQWIPDCQLNLRDRLLR
jgi:hypothetical protein